MTDKFDQWWDENKDGFPSTPLMEKCFDGGYNEGYADGVSSVRILRYVLIAIVVLPSVFMLSGCEDQYRYPCQNPDNFAKAECQRPKCLFTQMCPDYLVAPILKDQINAQPAQAAPEAASNR